ncbi:MAG: GAF domain-containing protein [bacterium]
MFKKAVILLKQSNPKYTWVGIYLLEGDELVLHNYLGKPSPPTRIPLGQGICGAAAMETKSIIVPDVNSDPRYLACSVETQSEIVVPIIVDDKVFGEIDIDSDFKDSFHEGDQEILEKVSKLLSQNLT